MLRNFMLVLSMVSMFSSLSNSGLVRDVDGEYVAEIKVADFLEESDVSEFTDYGLDMSNLTMNVDLALEEDGSFLVTFDGKSLEDNLSLLLENNMDQIITVALEQAGFSRDGITDEMAQSIGYDSADEMYASLSDTIMEELKDSYAIAEETFNDIKITGKSEVSGNSVNFIPDDEEYSDFNKGTINADGTISVTFDYSPIIFVFGKQE